MRLPTTFLTDRQRLTRVRSFWPAPTHDQARQLQASARLRPAAPPVTGSYNSLNINGENGSYWQVIFGDGHQVSTVHLADYHVHADIGHWVFNLAGILPDVIGIDLYVGAGMTSYSLSGGVNFIWNTRSGESLVPEIHLYKGANRGFAKGSSPAGLSASVSGTLLLVWASNSNQTDNRPAASSAWGANDYDWMDYRWTATLSLPTPLGGNTTVSPFISDWHTGLNKRTEWWGISLETPRSILPMSNMPAQTWHIAEWLAGQMIPDFSPRYAKLFGKG